MKFPVEQKFKLTEGFLEKYNDMKPPFGFNGLGEFVFMRTYSRKKLDGSNESWQEVVKRVVEGIYSIQKQHIEDYRLGWNQAKAQKSAQIMYDKIFNMKFLPAGRSLWAMGTPLIMEKGLTEALYNCSALSTENIKDDVGLIFANAMDFLMCGIGVGADTKGKNTVEIKQPKERKDVYVIPDSREGWVESLKLSINAFFGGPNYEFDYSEIRAEGEPIRGFGGTSSGYKPLKELHDNVYDILSKNVGNLLSERNIVDIFNFTGKAVVAGNVRRSAEIMLGEPTEEFLDLKNYDKNPERAAFGWASNNTVYATLGMDYSDIAERISTTGEPGLAWFENVHKYGRMNGIIDTEDSKATLFNPCGEISLEHGELCVSGTTRILTRNGYPYIKDVIGKTVDVWNGKEWSTVTPIKTGENKKLLRIHFSDGSALECTREHKFSINTSRNKLKEVSAKNLKIGDKLEKLVVSTEGNIGVKDEHAFEWGVFAGDGNLDDNTIEASIYGDKLALLDFGLKGKQGPLTLKKGYSVPRRRINFTNVLKDLDVAKELNSKEKGIPEYFFTLDANSILSFISGWIETDGSIQKNESSWNYRIYGTKAKMLDLQLLCRKAGINTATVSLHTEKGFKTNFGNRNYDLYYLTIPSHECKNIPSRIKIIPAEYIGTGVTKNNAHPEGREISNIKRQTVIKIEDVDGLHDTFCFTEHLQHKGVFGNVLTHQCNLCETFPTNHDTADEYISTLKYAYLYAKTVTLLGTNWVETNRVMLRNRRVGLSMTGIVQAIEKHGISKFIDYMEKGYNSVKHYDEIYSDWFAVPKSIRLTTAKPSGTLSLLAGATPGVHYPESKYYIRRVRLGKDSPFVDILQKAGYKIEDAFGQEDSTVVVEFPVYVGEVKTINDVTMWEQLALAALIQKYWADNSVSVTITFKENEKKDLTSALNLYQYQLKDVSFLPKLESGAYPQMPYEEISKETYEKMLGKVKPVDFSTLYGTDGTMEKFCNDDGCTIL